MSKVEDAKAIPNSGQKRPENEAVSPATDLDSSSQMVEDESLMSLEMALVRALQQLGKDS